MLALALLAQLAASATHTSPVLSFPEAGLDDSVAYQGYVTRIYRDASGNTVQVYLDKRQGRVVHVWADAENESIGFSARVARGGEVPLRWDGDGAWTARHGRSRSVRYRLIADAPRIDLGWFLLGSMRVERDFQYWGWHRAPFDSAEFMLTEMKSLLSALGQLSASTRKAHLAYLNAGDVDAVRSRLAPAIIEQSAALPRAIRVVQPSLDGRDTLTLELSVDPRKAEIIRTSGSAVIGLRARAGSRLSFTVEVSTTGKALTRLTRETIFTPQFLAFAKGTASGDDQNATNRARWLERNIRGVELLASREKLMAGLPTYGTYFGRDMLVTTLMMRPIWRPEMSEFAIASVLRKLSPTGEVSHEEALGGQADREAAAEYAMLVATYRRALDSGDRVAADTALRRAGAVLHDHRKVRENYHMIDDEFQLPVLVARWLSDDRVTDAHKKAFLLDASEGNGARLSRLLREVALVARMTSAIAADPIPVNLVSFARGEGGRWSSASWRDSGAGYGGGRFAMDVNAIWAPHALESIGVIFDRLYRLGFTPDSLERASAEAMRGTTLGRYAKDRAALSAAAATWSGAWRHFLVTLSSAEVRRAVDARFATMSADARAFWSSKSGSSNSDVDSLAFLALALDAEGSPIAVENSDPATRLFLGEHEGIANESTASAIPEILRDVRVFARPYPLGLLIEGVGPVVANDAFAPAEVGRAFDRDAYHGPRVVWGREVNLFLLGAAQHLMRVDSSGSSAAQASAGAYARELKAAIASVRREVERSGFRNELWSYEMREGRPVPVRYGSGGDVQLWSTTDLVVQFTLAKLGR